MHVCVRVCVCVCVCVCVLHASQTPLLRAQEAVNEAGLRLLRALGDKTSKGVVSNVGWEQEFFVIDREQYQRRPDLVSVGAYMRACVCACVCVRACVYMCVCVSVCVRMGMSE